MPRHKEITRIKRWYRNNENLLMGRFPHSCMCHDIYKCKWIMIGSFPLPPGYDRQYSRLLLQLPGIGEPISTKPEHFCLDADIKELDGLGQDYYYGINGEPCPDHFEGMKQFDLNLQTWQPSYRTRQGENFGTIIDTIISFLNGAVEAPGTGTPKNI